METAGRENPKRWATKSQQPSSWRGKSEQISFIQMGCEARKLPASGEIFFLTSPFIEQFRTCFIGMNFRSPPPLPISPFLTVSCRFVRELKGALSSRYVRRQHQTNHFAVCFSQSGGNRMCVDIHRRPNIRVTQQLLLDLEIYTQRM
jgi:hypothetical protein